MLFAVAELLVLPLIALVCKTKIISSASLSAADRDNHRAVERGCKNVGF